MQHFSLLSLALNHQQTQAGDHRTAVFAGLVFTEGNLIFSLQILVFKSVCKFKNLFELQFL